MIKGLKYLIGLILGGLILINISGCNFIPAKSHKGGVLFQSNINLPGDYNKYKDSISYNLNINISTPDVISKMTKYKNQISEEIPQAVIESYNVSEGSGDLRLSVPPGDAESISKLFASDPEVTQFNKNMNQVGTSYVEAAQNYIGYKALLDNFDDIFSIAKSRSKYPVDEAKLKRLLEDQVRNYESNLQEYSKQMNKTSVQIYISKRQLEQK